MSSSNTYQGRAYVRSSPSSNEDQGGSAKGALLTVVASLRGTRLEFVRPGSTRKSLGNREEKQDDGRILELKLVEGLVALRRRDLDESGLFAIELSAGNQVLTPELASQTNLELPEASTSTALSLSQRFAARVRRGNSIPTAVETPASASEELRTRLLFFVEETEEADRWIHAIDQVIGVKLGIQRPRSRITPSPSMPSQLSSSAMANSFSASSAGSDSNASSHWSYLGGDRRPSFLDRPAPPSRDYRKLASPSMVAVLDALPYQSTASRPPMSRNMSVDWTAPSSLRPRRSISSLQGHSDAVSAEMSRSQSDSKATTNKSKGQGKKMLGAMLEKASRRFESKSGVNRSTEPNPVIDGSEFDARSIHSQTDSVATSASCTPITPALSDSSHGSSTFASRYSPHSDSPRTPRPGTSPREWQETPKRPIFARGESIGLGFSTDEIASAQREPAGGLEHIVNPAELIARVKIESGLTPTGFHSSRRSPGLAFETGLSVGAGGGGLTRSTSAVSFMSTASLASVSSASPLSASSSFSPGFASPGGLSPRPRHLAGSRTKVDKAAHGSRVVASRSVVTLEDPRVGLPRRVEQV
ncbi:hypothetical protein OIO90_001113 [Microbotryomycetes sp. JL221]|nr:hypothetical protein OIO90_001113 [Microbotryomycetes sp. JL221]